jgi:hypothetical protein
VLLSSTAAPTEQGLSLHGPLARSRWNLFRTR